MRKNEDLPFGLSYLRHVNMKDGNEIALKFGAIAYLECSAKDNDGVREVFETAARALLPQQKKKRKMSLLKMFGKQ